MRKIIFSILMTLSFFQCLFSQNNIIKTSLDTNKILIGEQTCLHISVYVNQEDIKNVKFPFLQDTLINGLEIINQTNDTIISESITQITKNITITSFDTNYYIIPKLPIVIGLNTIKTEVQLLTVTTLEATNKPLNDINGNIEFEYSFSDYLDSFLYWLTNNKWWIISILVILMIFIIILKKIKNKSSLQEEIIELDPPHIEAYISLMKIKEMKLWENDNLKPFYSQITEVLKRYLNRQFQIATYEKTSEEIVKSLKFINLSTNEVLILHKLLTLSDLVKFAKEKPIESENIEVINLCENWIKNIEKKEIEKNEQ